MAAHGFSQSATIRRSTRLPERKPPRGSDQRRVLVVIVLALLTVAGLGLLGTNAVLNYRAQKAMITRMGPFNTKALPNVTVQVSDGRQVDITARVELRDGVEADKVFVNADRLRDRMVDRISTMPPQALEGTAGAKTVKEALGAAVRSEVDPNIVRGVYLDQFLIH